MLDKLDIRRLDKAISKLYEQGEVAKNQILDAIVDMRRYQDDKLEEILSCVQSDNQKESPFSENIWQKPHNN